MPPKKREDIAHKFFKQVDEKKRDDFQCMFCERVIKGGVNRAKKHLTGGDRNVRRCEKVPPEVCIEVKEFMEKKEALSFKQQFSRLNDFDEMNNDWEADEDDIEMMEMDHVNLKCKRSVTGSTSNPSGSSATSKKPPRKMGPIDSYFTPDAEVVVKIRQKKIDEDAPHKKLMRDRALEKFARWMYDAGIPFNAVNYDSFAPMIEAIGQYGPGMKPPSYHEVRVTQLKKEVKHTEDLMQKHKEESVMFGCSVMADGWSDKCGKTLINFLVNNSKGTMFYESIDASSYSKDGKKMFELLSDFVEKVGAKHVIQVVTDSASNNVLAGKMLQEKFPHLFWSPCAAHCLDLMLEDIFQIPRLKNTFAQAIMVHGYIYNRSGLLNLMRSFTNMKNLVRPAKTRFATAFLTLAAMHKQKGNLRKMITSDAWQRSKWAKESKGKNMAATLLNTSFWTNIVYALKVSGPIVRALRIADTETRPPMGYIYEAMNLVKENIETSFSKQTEKYEQIFKIIDQRWDFQLHQPLHAAGYLLNPVFFYSNVYEVMGDAEVMEGFYKCVERLVEDKDVQDKITQQLTTYKNAEGLFGIQVAIRQRATLAPADWWMQYGAGASDLQTFAIIVLSLTVSASGCERNWSTFEHIHTKKRNRMEQQRLNDLVFVKYNRTLRKSWEKRHLRNPLLSLSQIDESNEWLIGEMDGESSQDNEFVFEDDDLTWGDVAAASGAKESIQINRPRGTKNPSGGIVHEDRPKTAAQQKGKYPSLSAKGKGKSPATAQPRTSKAHMSPFELADEEEIDLDDDDIEEEEDVAKYLSSDDGDIDNGLVGIDDDDEDMDD